jgi:hypothetical protein
MIVLWFLAGGAVEALNALTRKWSVEQMQSRTQAIGLLIGGLLVRLAISALVLALAFRYSVLAGFMAFLGYWICRWIMIGWLHRRYRSISSRPLGSPRP